MQKKWIYLCSGLLLVACGQKAVSLEGNEYQYIAPNGTVISLDFIKGEHRIAGQVVNRYFGPYEQNKNQITFGPIGSTMMMGPQEAMQVESDYFQFLAQVNSFEMTDNTLLLKTSNGQEMIFEKK